MKLFITLITILFFSLFFSVNGNSQAIKVRSDGTILINGERNDEPHVDNYNGEVAALVYGEYGNYLSNGRFAIGDYGSMANHGGNIFIGEYGTDVDSDIMQLHGKLGMYFTRDYGEVVAYYKYSEGNKFNFNCDIYANGSILLTSDKRRKTNIKRLDNSLTLLKKVEGVSYNLLPKEEDKMMLKTEGTASDKEKKSQQEYEKQKAKHKSTLAEKTRLGFVAQDLQKIFPELVTRDSAGYLSVDYIGIIPVLVEAIKELESRIETLENDCCANNNTKSASITGTESYSNIGETKLYQNNPNPFSMQTTIKFEIPQEINSAQLHICNMTGTLLRTIQLSQRGNGSKIINGNEFTAGMYLYSLVCDGKIVDTKQMLLTE